MLVATKQALRVSVHVRVLFLLLHLLLRFDDRLTLSEIVAQVGPSAFLT